MVFRVSVERIEGNEGSYSYLYPFGDLVQGSFQGGFMCASNKEAFWEPL
jgi:hypothetical protein